jgi:hypothetical protein
MNVRRPECDEQPATPIARYLLNEFRENGPAGAAATSLSDLAIDIVSDDPEANERQLARRLKAQVEGDNELLEQALDQVSLHEIRLAKNYLDRKAGKKRRKKEDADDRQDKELTVKAVMQLRELVLNFNTELGKKIRDCTGYDLVELEGSNATRAGLYRELRKRVKREQLVGEAVQEAEFRAILKRINGDVSEIAKFFS